MRQADVRVGVDYAFVGNSYPEVVARIRPTAPGKNGQVEAELLDMPKLPKGSHVNGLTVKPGGKKCIVSTRRIYGTWEEWLAEVARRESVRARYEEESARMEAQIKDLTNPDPNRLVPQSYELEQWVGEDVRWDNSSREASLRLGETAAPFREWSRGSAQLLETAALFKDLPAGLCRDMVAALNDRENYQEWIEPHQSRLSTGATVAVTLARAARLMNSLRHHLSGLSTQTGSLTTLTSLSSTRWLQTSKAAAVGSRCRLFRRCRPALTTHSGATTGRSALAKCWVGFDLGSRTPKGSGYTPSIVSMSGNRHQGSGRRRGHGGRYGFRRLMQYVEHVGDLGSLHHWKLRISLPQAMCGLRAVVARSRHGNGLRSYD